MNGTMQFRDYIFKTNPQTITITQDGGAVTHFCPGRGELVQDLGKRGRTVRCAGSFWGSGLGEAFAQLEAFRRVVADRAEGVLFVPGMEPVPARLREFVYEATGDGKIIPYVMVFVEARVEA